MGRFVTRSPLALGFHSTITVLAIVASAYGARPAAAQSTPDTTPSGMVAFFMSPVTQCPSGWATATIAQGRLLLGVTNGNNVGVTVGTPLQSEQVPPSHQHSFKTTVSIPSHGIFAAHCCGNKQGAQSGSANVPDQPTTTGSAAWNLPLIQLVVCQKQ